MRISSAAWGAVGRRGLGLEAWWRDMTENLGRRDLGRSRGEMMQKNSWTSLTLSLLVKSGLFKVL